MNLFTPETLPAELGGVISFCGLAPQETLFRQGDVASAFYLVESGQIKLVRYTNEGKMIVLEVAKPGEAVGENALFSETYSCSAIAMAASRVIVYPPQTLMSVLRDYPELAQDLTAILVKKIQQLKTRSQWLHIRAAHQRLLQYLHYLAAIDNQREIILEQPLQEIARELNFTPETLSRALKRLETEGAIRRSGSVISLQTSAA